MRFHTLPPFSDPVLIARKFRAPEIHNVTLVWITVECLHMHDNDHELEGFPFWEETPKAFVFKGLLMSLLCSIFLCRGELRENVPD